METLPLGNEPPQALLEVSQLQYDRNDRIERMAFLEEFGFQASTEKRARQQGWPWPPSITLGKRIYYSRQGVAAWFKEQEAKAAARALQGAQPKAETVGAMS